MGKALKHVFLEAGFADIVTGSAFEHFGRTEDVAFLHGFISDWFFATGVVDVATAYGLASREQFDAWGASLDQWKDQPGAVGAFAFGEVVARKP